MHAPTLSVITIVLHTLLTKQQIHTLGEYLLLNKLHILDTITLIMICQRKITLCSYFDQYAFYLNVYALYCLFFKHDMIFRQMYSSQTYNHALF